MLDFQSKVKRQIEILGLCLSGNCGYKLSDLADLFGVEELTIKRDLQELRSNGIDIHSTRRNGLELTSKLDDKQLSEIILHYVGLSYKEYSIDKSTSLLINKLGPKALSFMVMLQRCIDHSLIAEIDYIKEASDIIHSRKIYPLLIFQSDGCWRVLSQHEDSVRQFLFDKIIAVNVTDKKFEKISDEKFNDLFAYSWKSWIGFERHDIKLKISREWAEFLSMRTFIPNQKTTQLDDGSILFEASVSSLREVANWVVSKGRGITVLEPVELKAKVIEIAEGALSNY